VEVEECQVASGQQTPYQETEFTDSLRLMETLIEALPPQQRVVLHLRHVEHCSFQEIEAITGLSANHIRVVLCRTRQRLSDCYAKVNRYESK
jgi:RNA polymerase sigma-70 factor (ECF subfamily)